MISLFFHCSSLGRIIQLFVVHLLSLCNDLFAHFSVSHANGVNAIKNGKKGKMVTLCALFVLFAADPVTKMEPADPCSPALQGLYM